MAIAAESAFQSAVRAARPLATAWTRRAAATWRWACARVARPRCRAWRRVAARARHSRTRSRRASMPRATDSISITEVATAPR
eukprot:scaffold114861_cov27-Phaeocystis_antarctica.AAC.1